MLFWLKLSQCLYVLHEQSNAQQAGERLGYSLALAYHSRNHSILQDVSICSSSSVAQKQVRHDTIVLLLNTCIIE